MADELEALLGRVSDEGLRTELRHHIERLRRKRQFGLVFESHLPERVRLPDHPIRRGAKVVRRAVPPDEMPQEVLGVQENSVVLAADGGSEEATVDDVVVVAEFGEPIYPGFRRLGSIERGGEKPAHIVIKGENYHALEALQFSHAGQIDCIYIDPPYNTGAKDWKYDNDYVDSDDGYRHSKWLAFMDRRLRLAKELLNPEGSVLVVTVDEKEFLRLGLLLEQVFPDSRRQAVSIVNNPKGASRPREFARTNEFAFYVMSGQFGVPMLEVDVGPSEIRWPYLRRSDVASARGTKKGGPRQFYPIYVADDGEWPRIVRIGDPLSPDDDIGAIPELQGATAVFPIRKDGRHMNWGLTPEALKDTVDGGFVRVSRSNDNPHAPFNVAYLTTTSQQRVLRGEYEIADYRPDGTPVVVDPAGKRERPTTSWNEPAHDAGAYGTTLLNQLIGDRRFPYPKSLYAVEDCLRIAVAERPDAIVLDFFAGSGTTAHAVVRLNRQDGGRRQSILVTNNEVSEAEERKLTDDGFQPGDPEWEAQGIFDHICRPRIEAAVTGLRPDGHEVVGDYKFADQFPMAEGFEENVEFLDLKYLDLEDVELDRAFAAVASMLWLRAGGTGPVIDRRCDESGVAKPFDVTESYGVLFEPDHWRAFVEKLPDTATAVFVVTDSPSVFATVAAELPSDVDVVRLYENYLSTFTINRGL